MVLELKSFLRNPFLPANWQMISLFRLIYLHALFTTRLLLFFRYSRIVQLRNYARSLRELIHVSTPILRITIRAHLKYTINTLPMLSLLETPPAISPFVLSLPHIHRSQFRLSIFQLSCKMRRSVKSFRRRPPPSISANLPVIVRPD